MVSIRFFLAGVIVGCGSPFLWTYVLRPKFIERPHFNPIPTGSEPSLFLVNDEVIRLGSGQRLTVDDIVLGGSVLWDQANTFKTVRWKGMNVVYTPSDLMAVHAMLWEERPDLVIELGTHSGGNAVYFMETMSSYNPGAHVITIDSADRTMFDNDYRVPVVRKSTNSSYWGSAIRHIVGQSLSKTLLDQVEELVNEFKPVKILLIEDSWQGYDIVLEHLVRYQKFLKSCDWIMVHGIKGARLYDNVGPLAATRAFMHRFPLFQVNRMYEFLISTDMPQGWLQKASPHEQCVSPAGAKRPCEYGSSVRDQLCRSRGEREPKVWLYAPPT